MREREREREGERGRKREREREGERERERGREREREREGGRKKEREREGERESNMYLIQTVNMCITINYNTNPIKINLIISVHKLLCSWSNLLPHSQNKNKVTDDPLRVI